MIAVAPTDLDWFRQLRSSAPVGEVNFWTPTPWNVRSLAQGDRFYFMLKSPIRKIGGFGIYVRYENRTPADAWNKYGTSNGVRDLAELIERTSHYIERRAVATESEGQIGCIILRDCQFFDEDRLIDPDTVGLDFPATIVKLKYFEDDPMDVSATGVGLTVLTDYDEIANAQSIFKESFQIASSKSGDLDLGFQGGRHASMAYFVSQHDVWGAFKAIESRYWTAFGTGDPFEKPQLSIVVEINSPLKGIDRRVGGAFIRNSDGRVALVHRGRVGGGRENIGKSGFFEVIDRADLVQFRDGDRASEAVLIGYLDDPEFVQRVANFVRTVERYKAAATRTNATWWVNQGKTYGAERAGEYIWAPQKNKAGIALAFHTNVGQVKAGDVIVHYANGRIVALGSARTAGAAADKPAELNSEDWGREGWAATVRYFALERPIALDEIPPELRAANEGGPFVAGGSVKQGYLFPLQPDIASALRQEFSDRWPEGSPWYGPAHPDRPLHIVLKWKPSAEGATIDRHRSIAEEKGSVWWGKFGEGKISTARLDRLRQQIAAGTPTFAFLYRSGEVWRTRMLDVTTDPSIVPDDMIPSYYSKESCSAFFELSNFESLTVGWPTENLVLASRPDEPDRMAGALGNQATPLFVYARTGSGVVPEPTDPPNVPDIEWLVRTTLWPKAVLEELCLDIRTTSPQILLAGPPGTGKTWVAKHIAEYLTKGKPLASRLVQWHAGYGYEEFVQGLRPVVDEKSGSIRFSVVDGIVVRMAKEIEDDEQLHVLVIDEFNRANVPRVLGELMYLFEYRDEPLDLQYSTDFSLPGNLKFIGTMNTADRSIRSLDTALRRRFEIFECLPDRAILERYYANGLGVNSIGNSLFDGFEQLNARLAVDLDRHHTVGHTFFMMKDMNVERLRKVWKYKLGPLIEEYFFDQRDLAGEFTPGKFWPELLPE